MAIEFAYDPELNRLVIQGKFTIHHAAEALEHLRDRTNLSLDLAAVEEMDGAGLQLLILTRRDTGMRLVAASEAVVETIRRAGLDALLEVPA
jgi:anti-sigma B factor antagonist